MLERSVDAEDQRDAAAGFRLGYRLLVQPGLELVVGHRHPVFTHRVFRSDADLRELHGILLGPYQVVLDDKGAGGSATTPIEVDVVRFQQQTLLANFQLGDIVVRNQAALGIQAIEDPDLIARPLDVG